MTKRSFLRRAWIVIPKFKCPYNSRLFMLTYYLNSCNNIDYSFMLFIVVSLFYSTDVESKMTRQNLVSKLCTYDFINNVCSRLCYAMKFFIFFAVFCMTLR